jgi:hypothetical protein
MKHVLSLKAGFWLGAQMAPLNMCRWSFDGMLRRKVNWKSLAPEFFICVVRLSCSSELPPVKTILHSPLQFAM